MDREPDRNDAPGPEERPSGSDPAGPRPPWEAAGAGAGPGGAPPDGAPQDGSVPGEEGESLPDAGAAGGGGPRPPGGLRFSQEEAERPGQSYWEIVGGQFGKNRLAVWSMRILGLLFLLAVYAPVLSFNAPFVYVDEMRGTAEDGDRIEVGPYAFTLTSETISDRVVDEDGDEQVVQQKRYTLAAEDGTEIPLLGEVWAGSGPDCKFCRDDLAPLEARIGTWKDQVWVEDHSSGGRVTINGRTPEQTTFPWFQALFDRNEFETEIDIFFNILIFYLPPAVLVFWLLRRLLGGATAAARRRWARVRFACVLLLAGGAAALFVHIVVGEELRLPYRDYKAEEEASERREGYFPLVAPHSYRQDRTSVRLKSPFEKAFFGKTDEDYTAEARKGDRVLVGPHEFTIALLRTPEDEKAGREARLHFRGGTLPRPVPIEGTVTFGRSRECTVRVSVVGIEPVHASARLREDGAVLVEDLARSGDVLVNNVPTHGIEEPVFSYGYVLGTDNLGRNVFTRLLYGTRISLTIGLVAVSLYVLIGILIGGIAGYFGGVVDLLISRLIEIMLCFPSFFLILTLVSVLGQSIFYVMLIIGVTRWTGVARLIRGEFLKQRQIDYVIAARALGVSRFKIMFKHILPNAVAPVLVAASFGVAGAILVETGLSFLGLGDIRTPSWGQILQAGRESGVHHLIHMPGLAILLTVAIMNLMGEGLRDALDPKLRK